MAQAIKTVKIVYYSGTGGTKRVAQCFERYFQQEGWNVYNQHLMEGPIIDRIKHDLFLLVFPVYACNAPKLVYDWIEDAQPVKRIPAVVISVSGGGEVSPNTACRLSSIKLLEKKGYEVTYEKMLIMPSNWIVPVKSPLDLMLLEVLPRKVQTVINDVIRGKRRRTEPLLIDKILSLIGKVEKEGAKFFGKRIKVLEGCTGCGWCTKHCPAGNIALEEGQPQFGGSCHLCLGCIYGCPEKALEPGIAKFIVIKQGYNLEKLEKKLPAPKNIDVEKLAKGYLWSGVRKYLMNQDN